MEPASEPVSPPPPTADSTIRKLLRRIRSLDRRFLIVALIGLFCAFLWQNRADFEQGVVVVRTASFPLVLLALGLALLTHLLFTATQSAILRRLGYEIPLPVAVKAYFERQTVATIVPVGTASSLVMTTRQFGAYGVTSGPAVLSFAVYSLLGYLSFACLLVPVLGWLVLHGGASLGIEIAAAILLVLLLLITGFFIRFMQGRPLPFRLESRVPDSAKTLLVDLRQQRISARSLAIPAIMALLADLLGPLSLYISLRAVGADVSIGDAAIGYVVGTLFVLVTPVFQGIGLVELSMTVILERLGVPLPAALGATLIYRMGEVWLPVVFGVAFQAVQQPVLRGFPAKLPAIWTGLTGTLSILSLITPLHPHDLHQFRPVEFFRPDATTLWSITLAAGLLLLYLSYGLLRRQRLAWWATVVLSGVIALTHLRHEHDRVIVVIAVVNLGLLLIYRKRFQVRNDPPSFRVGLVTFALSLLFAFLYGVIGFWLATPHEFGREFDIQAAIRSTFNEYFTAGDTALRPNTRRADWFLTSFTVVGMVTLGVSLIALTRPVIWRRTVGAERQRQIDEATSLITRYGDSSQDFFKYWPDKDFFFSGPRDGVVSYGVSNSVALVMGDPVAADEAAFARLLREFLTFVDRNGWRLAIHQGTPIRLAAYHAAGLISLNIGGEAVVGIDGFTLSGKKMKSFRGVMNRYERDGYRAEFHQPPLDDTVLSQLREISDDWLKLDGRRERGFTLGSFTDDYIRGSTVLTVVSAEGQIEAFVNLIPDGVAGELTFDLMRHRVSAPNGAMDFVLLNLIEYGRAQGYHRLSLGMVPFVMLDSWNDQHFRERVIALFRTRFEHYFAANSLYEYKDKFNPIWEPRYLVYASDTDLPRIGLALTRLTEYAHIAEPGEDGENR